MPVKDDHLIFLPAFLFAHIFTAGFMYKVFLAICICAFCLTRPANGIKPHLPIHKKVNDTLFLVREITKDYYHAVYIEKNRQSAEYKRLLNFKMDTTEAAGYHESYLSFKQKVKSRLKKASIAGLPTQWMPAYRYQNKYYIYSPSEWGNIDRRIITDSTIVYWDMEDPFPELLSLTGHIGNTYTFKTSHYMSGAKSSKLVIHIVDTVTKLAVWEDFSQPLPYRYGLYIPRGQATRLDMIVNYCAQNKVFEFQFDKIDYAALLKRK